MTTSQLAAGYLQKCLDRMAALEVLLSRKAFSDVVREAQEIVELALKGMLRAIGIDPPKWHDVGDLLLEYASKLQPITKAELESLAAASKRLRKEREFSFYGDIDFIPTAEYDLEDANEAFTNAQQSTQALSRVLKTIP
jgi:HEPN domain-containing protein